MDIKTVDQTFLANTYKKFDLLLLEGNGSVVRDDKGKEYIDLTSGIAVNAFGFADQDWIDAVTKQLYRIQHTSNLYYTEPGAKLAKTLCEKTALKKVFFGNSGAEANECAIKTARKYSYDKYGAQAGRNVIISLKNSFHGRTIATLSATGQESLHTYFDPFLEGFEFVSPDNTEEMLSALANPKVCAVLIEIIQGEGGVNELSEDFVKQTAAYAQEHDILVLVDEVQTGNGRTGKYFAYMNYGISPDVVTTAKGLGGGLPIGACLFNEKTMDVLSTGSHGSTFGANPIACAGALSIIDRIDDAFLEEVEAKGVLIREALKGTAKKVTGIGMMVGIETEKDADLIANELIEDGVLVLTAHGKLRLLPALNIDNELLLKALEIIKKHL
jgi:acetylornithine/N-succinyldiaminopimelate aminotransferase